MSAICKCSSNLRSARFLIILLTLVSLFVILLMSRSFLQVNYLPLSIQQTTVQNLLNNRDVQLIQTNKEDKDNDAKTIQYSIRELYHNLESQKSHVKNLLKEELKTDEEKKKEEGVKEQERVESAFHGPKVINYGSTGNLYSSVLWKEGCPNEEQSVRETCTQPRKKILFVKVHKCGGSTFASLILRYGQKHQLKMALPLFGDAHFGYPKFYRPYYVLNYEPDAKYDLIANHFVYDRCYIQNDFPRKEVIYTTILRDPWSHFVSSINYFPFPELSPPHLNWPYMKSILENPDKFAVPVPFHVGPHGDAKKNIYKNMMATDLGFPNSQSSNQTAIDMFIKQIDSDFDLVMITDFYHESVVLLRRLMCWEWKDVFFLKINSQRLDRVKGEEETDYLKGLHTIIDNVDYQIYDFFRDKLEKKMEKLGPDFLKEVEAFRTVMRTVYDFCYFKTPESRSSITLTLGKNDYMPEMTISHTDCNEYKTMPEILAKNIKSRNGMIR